MNDLLFLDLETTGLDPKRCQIIEVACALVRPPEMAAYATFETIVGSVTDPDAGHWEHFAWQMHNTSGLLAEVHESWAKNAYAQQKRGLFSFLSQHLGTKQANLAGNSIHFDRSFLVAQWPEILPFLTHRHLDISSLRLACETRGLPLWKGETAHRAMADVRSSIEQYHYYMRTLREAVAL